MQAVVSPEQRRPRIKRANLRRTCLGLHALRRCWRSEPRTHALDLKHSSSFACWPRLLCGASAVMYTTLLSPPSSVGVRMRTALLRLHASPVGAGHTKAATTTHTALRSCTTQDRLNTATGVRSYTHTGALSGPAWVLRPDKVRLAFGTAYHVKHTDCEVHACCSVLRGMLLQS